MNKKEIAYLSFCAGAGLSALAMGAVLGEYQKRLAKKDQAGRFLMKVIREMAPHTDVEVLRRIYTDMEFDDMIAEMKKNEANQ